MQRLKLLSILLLLAAPHPYVYGLSRGTVKQNQVLSLPIKIDGVTVSTGVTIDSNWRWIHAKNNYENCFDGSGWVSKYCPDKNTCDQNCVIDGVDAADWAAPYGVSVSGNAVKLQYVTKGPYGTNVGSRLYLTAPNGNAYQGFDMRNKEIAFTVDVSNLPCGTNGAVYFVEMPLNNPYDADLTAAYGVNYGDAQCPRDIKYITGSANVGTTPLMGACSNEYDLWEANSQAQSLALHPCADSVIGVTPCTNDLACGVGANRQKGVCDRDGADYNPNRLGNRTFYGRGSGFTIDTTKPLRVITQFPTDSSGKINKVVRYYQQGGRTVFGAVVDAPGVSARKTQLGETDRFTQLGGFDTMTTSFARKHVLVLSLWDDDSVQMRWLDSVYPIGSTKPGDYRGPCSSHNNSPAYLRSTYPGSYVVYSDIAVGPIQNYSPDSTAPPSPTPTPPPPSPTPTPPPTTGSCASLYAQCGGSGYTGPTTCCSGTCTFNSQYYSQCLPGTTSPPTPPPTPPPTTPPTPPPTTKTCCCSV